MKRATSWVFIICLIITSCNIESEKESIEKYKVEILKTERDFAKMAKQEGIPKAFLTYAAEEAVLNRNNTVLKGKEAIKTYFEKQTLLDVNLNWTPDFVDVASSGDLGYTYGKYVFSARDTSGKLIETQGVFHTVWKKQADGKWRFVWD